MTTKQKYLVNKLATELTLKAGYLNIPPNGYAKINAVDETEETVVFAIGRDWAEVTDTKPEDGVAAVTPVDIEVTEAYKGMTIEELKAQQAETAAAPKVAAATGVELGAKETVVPAETETTAKPAKKGK